MSAPGRDTGRVLLLAVALVAVAALVDCTTSDRPGPLGDDDLARLRAEVDSLRERFEARVAGDPLVTHLSAAEGDILVGLRIPFVQDIASWAARSYLDDVELHLAPDVTVYEGDDVRVKIGPISVHAGEWRVEVTINSVRARLRADSIRLAVTDTSSLSAVVVVGVSEATGDASIRFTWDASTVASIVCRDFQVDQTFGGVVEPFTYRVSGQYEFEATSAGIRLLPSFERPRLRVSPIPTPESWARARGFLDEQNNIFRCGLALKPDDMVQKLDRLLRKGFEFQLPEVLFQSVGLPARIEDRVDLGSRVVEIRNAPVWLRMTPEAIWYGSDLDVDATSRPDRPASTAEGSGNP